MKETMKWAKKKKMTLFLKKMKLLGVQRTMKVSISYDSIFLIHLNFIIPYLFNTLRIFLLTYINCFIFVCIFYIFKFYIICIQ